MDAIEKQFSPNRGTSIKEWTILFVDIVGSTQMKYGQGDNISQEIASGEVADLIGEFYAGVRNDAKGNAAVKFTGDGAMVVWESERNAPTKIAPEKNGCKMAIEAAERIVLHVDCMNLRFRAPRFHIRIGITTGNATNISGVTGTELSGQAPDLAARLCAEADIDSVLIDDKTKEGSKFMPHFFAICPRRLSLKGVPPQGGPGKENFWFFEPRRLVRRFKVDPFSKGLLALYPDRDAVEHDFSPTRLLHLAAPKTEILIAGRTLIGWTKFEKEIAYVASEKSIRFKFLTSSKEACTFLDDEQQAAIRNDLPEATNHFQALAADLQENFEIRESSQLILDGITCATIRLPGNDGDHRLVALQDINAAPGRHKSTAVWMCICSPTENAGDGTRVLEKPVCMACGLYGRTKLLFNNANAPMSAHLSDALQQFDEGLEARKNRLKDYLPLMKPRFEHIADPVKKDLPPPICVQIQISSTCSTHCRMCDHWQDSHSELNTQEWTAIFDELKRFGVKTLVLSGGEPLERMDFCELVRNARKLEFGLGLLTSGSGKVLENSFEEVLNAINEDVDWVSVSIDGAEVEDANIRNSVLDKEKSGRGTALRRFCGRIEQSKVRLAATVTLQQDNVCMDLDAACRFIHGLGIPQVNFKLATGANNSLAIKPKFLIDKHSLNVFKDTLWEDQLPYRKGNNLAYLRRSFAEGVFDIDDASDGAPVRQFYGKEKLRCFTPYVFALIDCDGSVFPCCHLYRDNHSRDQRTIGDNGYRQKHRMGKIGTGQKFSEVWKGDKYVKLRKELAVIDPVGNVDYLPCGECTRHCQHNRALSRSYEVWAKNHSEFFKILSAPSGNTPTDSTVWF